MCVFLLDLKPLRLLILRCSDGAAVFYTAQTLPSSFAKLRQYILHRLFAAPPSVSSATGNPGSTSSTAPAAASAPSSSRTIQPAASSRASFPFPHRANVIDRDGVLVPAGWDSWGKIKILRERFDCEACGEGWSADLEALSGTQLDGGDDSAKRRGLKKEYEMVVVDFDAEDPVRLSFSSALCAYLPFADESGPAGRQRRAHCRSA